MSKVNLYVTTPEMIVGRLATIYAWERDNRTRGINEEINNFRTPLMPLRVSLAGTHPELGYIRSEGYFTVSIHKETFNTWREKGVRDIHLEWTDCEFAHVFGGA